MFNNFSFQLLNFIRVVGEGVTVVPSPRISFSSSLAKSWEYGIVGVFQLVF